MNNDLKKAFNILDSLDSDFDGPKKLILIDAAEAKLGVVFPKSYRTFLEKYGCGDVLGFEIYGVIHDDFENSSIPDSVWLTLDQRKSGLSKSMIIIATTPYGGFYAIDTDQATGDNESAIVEIAPNGRQTVTNNNFGNFLLEQIESFRES